MTVCTIIRWLLPFHIIPWRWQWYILPKHQWPHTILHGIIIHKSTIHIPSFMIFHGLVFIRGIVSGGFPSVSMYHSWILFSENLANMVVCQKNSSWLEILSSLICLRLSTFKQSTISSLSCSLFYSSIQQCMILLLQESKSVFYNRVQVCSDLCSN